MQNQNSFEIEDGILKACLGAESEIRIPDGVCAIGEGAFKGMAHVLKVTLPDGIKKIGPAAFKGCRQLKSISFPDGLEEIGEYAFHRCHGIEEMIFPKSVTRVDGYAFLYCDGLKKVVMEGPERLGKAVFSHNLSLREVTLNKKVDDSNFGEEVFEGCVQIHRIILSDEIYEVSNLIEAMDSCSEYPKVIKSIAKSVYHSLQIEDGTLMKFNINLKSIVLPEGIIAIGKGCFYDKKGIVSITLPKSLQEIKANAFLNCLSLEEVTFRNEEVSLDEKAFRGCCNLKKVHIQGTASPLMDGTKEKEVCQTVTYLLEEESENGLVSRIRDQVLGDFYVSGKILVRYLGNEEQIQIPKEVEIIGERCFCGKEQLKTVLCPDNLLEIREQAFAGCVTLQNVVLSDRLRRVEREAFAECKKLLKCNLPETVEYIGEYAFRRCFMLRSFEPWPAQAKIHPYAFYRAKHLEEAEKELRKGESIPPYAYAKRKNIRSLRLSGINRIGKYAYYACPDLEEVFIDAPECVIEQNAFANCPKLNKICLNVKELHKGCFSYCRALFEVRLSGISILPEECFAGCYSLQKLEVDGITRMEERCFDECICLNSFDFSGIKVIGERAFERCDSLTSVVLRQVECGYHAFADCAALETLDLSEDTVLKSGAFIGCTQVTTIVYNGRSHEFSKFSDSLNHAGNPFPSPVREVIASIYSCFDVREGKVLAGYSQDAAKITIPQDVEEVGPDVFRDHVRLREIQIPETVRTFGSQAFSMTAWLEERRKKEGMVVVNHVLLDGAACVGRIVIPPDVRRVASWCFAGNGNVTELVIPSERIGIESLAFRNCLNLKKITDWEKKEYDLNDMSDLVRKDYPDLIRRIFSECVNCFKLNEQGVLVESTGNIRKLQFPDGIKAVGDGVYQDCHLLETIVLSKDTEQIGKYSFENSKWLRIVLNAGNIAYIGPQAFSGCQSLESIDLSDHLRELGVRCFEHCSSLKEINLSSQLKRIPERAFFRCKSLNKVCVPMSVKEIGAEAFAFCDGLEEVCLAADTHLAEGAFAHCDKLQMHYY